MSGKVFSFIIDTSKPLSMGRIGEYMVQLEKLLGVPVELIEITQDKDEMPRKLSFRSDSGAELNLKAKNSRGRL
jgi:hypothetical protein